MSDGYMKIREGGATVRVPKAEKVSKEMEVFYNPAMKLNRDVSTLLLKTLGEERRGTEGWEGFSVGSPLAGSGVRECRFLVELEPGILSSLEANDYAEEAAGLIRENITLNEASLNCDEIEVSCNEASKFLLESNGYGYIDIDPFGNPGPFLDAAVKRVQREGILAVTATDTSALSGTYADSCLRKYWATPMRNHLMHDVGLRILIRRVQLIGSQYEKSLVPIYSYSKEHYMRIFFLCQKQGRKEAAAVLKRHVHYHHCTTCLRTFTSPRNGEECCGTPCLTAGPLWGGPLWDAALARRMARMNAEWANGRPENQRFLDLIAEEAKECIIGLYPFNLVRKVLRRMPLKKEELLKREGVLPTHLEGNAVRAREIGLLFEHRDV